MPFFHNNVQPSGIWEKYFLIMPAVSVGNVGQLAIDLLLNNLDVKQAGYMHDGCIIPIAGLNSFNTTSTKLTTSWEFYVCQEKKLVIVQQRAPIARGRSKEYKRLLFDWIKEHKFKMTIVLSSTFSQFYTIEELQGVPMHYLCTTSDATVEEENKLKELLWKQFYVSHEANPSESIPGGGITKSFLEECERSEIPCVALMLICSEGYNYPEAHKMADSLDSWLKLKQVPGEKWRVPISWMLPYGCDAPPTIY